MARVRVRVELVGGGGGGGGYSHGLYLFVFCPLLSFLVLEQSRVIHTMASTSTAMAAPTVEPTMMAKFGFEASELFPA